MENRLKPETCSVINRLVAANVRTIMCTGDNILTALSVARDCDMINEEDRVIIIEANPGEDPKFTYAELLKQKVKEIEFEPKVNFSFFTIISIILTFVSFSRNCAFKKIKVHIFILQLVENHSLSFVMNTKICLTRLKVFLLFD